jgi:hypothetical protein
MTKKYDFVIVGGGIAGLFTAYKLSETDAKILLIEKSDYLGGRVYTVYEDNDKTNDLDIHYECGAARFNQNHIHIIQCIIEMGLYDDIIHLDHPIHANLRGTEKDFEKVYKTNKTDPKLTLKDITEYLYKKAETIENKRKMTLKELMNKVMSKEATQFFIDAFGYNSEIEHLNAEDALRLFQNDFMDQDKDKELFFYFSKNGLTKIIDKLEKTCESNGVEIRKNTLLIDFVGDIKLTTSIGKIETKTLILTGDKQSLMNIPALKKFKELDSVKACPLNRIYAIYPKNNGKVWFHNLHRTTTDNDLRHIIPIDAEKGLIMISYSDDKYADKWHKYKEEGKLQEHIQKEIKKLYPEKNIPEPFYLEEHYWKAGLHVWKKGIDSSKVMKKIQKPFKDKEVFIVGETYCDNQGWMDGALLSAIQVLEQLKVPNYKLNVLETEKKQEEQRVFTKEEIDKENKEFMETYNEPKYIIIQAEEDQDYYVVNVGEPRKNTWLDNHPGGRDKIMKAFKADPVAASKMFQDRGHSKIAKEKVKELSDGIIKIKSK